jgi:hypothetical protein
MTSRTLAVLVFCLLPLAAAAAPAPDLASDAPVAAHLGKTEGENPRTHVHVEIKRSDVTDVTVELFDAQGVVLHTYALQPRQGDVYRPIMNVEVPPVFARHVETARVTGFSIRKGGSEALFDTGMIKAQVNPCANQCDYTRIECHNDCFCFGCTGATYSCTGEPGSCVANCNCTGCGTSGDCNDW